VIRARLRFNQRIQIKTALYKVFTKQLLSVRKISLVERDDIWSTHLNWDLDLSCTRGGTSFWALFSMRRSPLSRVSHPAVQFWRHVKPYSQNHYLQSHIHDGVHRATWQKANSMWLIVRRVIDFYGSFFIEWKSCRVGKCNSSVWWSLTEQMPAKAPFFSEPSSSALSV
jgi:hypothetical protein